MKSISTGLLCNALAILLLVWDRTCRPFSILTIVVGETLAHIARTTIVRCFSSRISFNVFMSDLPINRINAQGFDQSSLCGEVGLYILTVFNSGYSCMSNTGFFSEVPLAHEGFFPGLFQIHGNIIPQCYKNDNKVLTQ